jgi:hypothetical protein
MNKKDKIEDVRENHPRAPTAGYIYTIYSPTFSNFIKIGRTIDPSKRFQQYLDYNPNCDWEFIHISKIFDDCIEVESKLIQRLFQKQVLVKYNREYYDVKDKNIIINMIQELEEEF